MQAGGRDRPPGKNRILTTWCSGIGSLTSLDACNSGASRPVTSENQFHCNRLYMNSYMGWTCEWDWHFLYGLLCAHLGKISDPEIEVFRRYVCVQLYFVLGRTVSVGRFPWWKLQGLESTANFRIISYTLTKCPFDKEWLPSSVEMKEGIWIAPSISFFLMKSLARNHVLVIISCRLSPLRVSTL